MRAQHSTTKHVNCNKEWEGLPEPPIPVVWSTRLTARGGWRGMLRLPNVGGNDDCQGGMAREQEVHVMHILVVLATPTAACCQDSVWCVHWHSLLTST
jgi:hypothetical protein